MRGLSRLFTYVRFFFEADTKEARARAGQLACTWCKSRNPHWTYMYQLEYSRFVSSYMFNYCHIQAKSKLKGLAQ